MKSDICIWNNLVEYYGDWNNIVIAMQINFD